MPDTYVRLPDGSYLRVPEGTPDEQVAPVIQQASASLLPPKSWSEVPGRAWQNTPASAGRLVTNMAGAIGAVAEGATRPPDADEMRHPAAMFGGPMGLAGLRLTRNLPAMAEGLVGRAKEYADPKKLLSEDPVGVLADVAGLVGGGAGLAGRAGLTGTARVLRGAGRLNPNPVGLATAGAVKAREFARTRAPGILARRAKGAMQSAQGTVPAWIAKSNKTKDFADIQIQQGLPMTREALETLEGRIEALNTQMEPALSASSATFQPSLKNMPQAKSVLRQARTRATEAGYPHKKTAVSERAREFFAPLREPVYGRQPLPTQTISGFRTAAVPTPRPAAPPVEPAAIEGVSAMTRLRPDVLPVSFNTGTAFGLSPKTSSQITVGPTLAPPPTTGTRFLTQPGLIAGETPLPTAAQTVQQGGRIQTGTAPRTVSATQMQALKRAVDEQLNASWGGTTEGHPAMALNRALRSDISQQIGTAVPEVADLNRQLSDLYPLQDLMKHRVRVTDGAKPLPMSAGIGSMLVHGPKVALQVAGALMGKAINDPVFLSKAAIRMQDASARLSKLPATTAAIEPFANMSTFARLVTDDQPTAQEARQRGQIVSQAVDELADRMSTQAPQQFLKDVQQTVHDVSLLTGGVAPVTRQRDRAAELARQAWSAFTTEVP